MENKRIIESASVFERSGIRAIRVRSIEVLLYFIDTPFSDTNVRLVGGLNNYSGRVEVYFRGSWKTVCDRSFSHAEVNVICRQVGHYDGER